MTSAVYNKYSCTTKVLSLKPVNVKKSALTGVHFFKMSVTKLKSIKKILQQSIIH